MPSGRKPSSRSTSTSATCTAAIDTNELMTSSKAASGASVRICLRFTPCGLSAAVDRSMLAAKIGSANSVRAMPAHCEPMPENTNHNGRTAPLSHSCRKRCACLG